MESKVPPQNLVDLITSLTPDQQNSVLEFVEFLKKRSAEPDFLSAVDEFIDQHPELLRRLAQ